MLSGSFVAAGAGRYRATRVGAEAYAAKLAEDARRFTLTRSELRSGIDKILTYVTYAIVPTAALLFFSQLRSHDSWRAAVSGAVAGTVAMVPEGLVLLTSLAFAVAVVRLARRRVLVQELPAVEGLARVDVLCIDKTGTLTEGKLTVRSVGARGRRGGRTTCWAPSRRTMRRPTPRCARSRERYPQAPAGWQETGSVPFSSARKWSAAAFDGHGAWVLGAPDVLLERGRGPRRRPRHGAARVRGRSPGRAAGVGARPRRRGAPRAPRARPRSWCSATARVPMPPRPSAYFAEQDVRVKVISGDDPRTVGAIARELGMEGADEPVDARTLPEDREELGGVLEQHSVFGRVTPQQKRAMVLALQAHGHTVAMTGDGVNDALALKDADIGVAMGSGSDATRAVAQLVLLDSTFDALPSVVAEGRRVLGNIERTSGLYLNKTVYAMLISLAIGVAGFAFPFLPRHLTLVGAITIGIPSFFLALAPNTDRFRPGLREPRAALRDPHRHPRGGRDVPRVHRGHERGGRDAPRGADHGGDGADVDRAAGALDPGGAAHARPADPDLVDGGALPPGPEPAGDACVLRARDRRR